MDPADSIAHAKDGYTQPDDAIEAPPANWRATLKYLGPSVIISATIVGSGEIILTASLGAAVGYVMLWWVLFSCWSKSILQAELARYVVLNPVRARMVPDAGDWPWSSYRTMIGQERAPAWLETDWLLGRFDRERSRAQAAYASFVY